MKEKTLYFHVGHKKTGSSAIQAFLALNQNMLAKKGIFYPGETTFFQPFQTSSGNCTELMPLIKAQKFDEVSRIIDKQSQGYSSVLYSNEMLLDIFQKEEIFEKFAEALQAFDLKLVIYIRNQADFTNSLYNQLVKNHDWTKEIDLDICPDYASLILRLSQHLDKGNMLVRPYEKKQFVGGDVFHDFMDCLGVQYSDEFKLPDKVINPSLSAKALRFRMLANQTHMDEYSIEKKNRLNQMLGEYTVLKEGNQTAPMLLSEKQQEEIRRRFEKSNEKVAKDLVKSSMDELFLETKLIPPQASELTIEACESISRFILERMKETDIDQKLQSYLVQGILKDIDETHYSDALWLKERILDIPFSRYQRIKTKPLRVSKSIQKFKNHKGKFVVEASATDPWFQRRRIFGNYGKNIMIRIEGEFPEVCEFKVYYKGSGQKFSETYAEGKWVPSGFGRNIILINSPFNVKVLRFDPGDNAGIYIIHKLDIMF